MLHRAQFVFLLLALLPAAHAAEREVTRTFPVAPGCTLKIDSYRGRITITEHDAPTIDVKVLIATGAETEHDVARAFAALQLDLTSEGNVVTVRARNPSETRVWWIWEQKRQLALDFQIAVPRQCSVDLALGDGRVTVGNLAGQHRARVGKGEIDFKRIDGSVDVRVETGNVIVSRCTGALTVRTTIGSIRAGTVGGAADLKTDSGEIDVLAARSGLVAVAAAGDVAVGFPKGATGEVRATADGGNVLVRIDPAADCTVDASARWGRVESKLALVAESGAVGTKQLTARLNAGGPRLLLRASGGDVRISRLDFDVELTEQRAVPPGN
jgi:hypothetical protein